LWDFSDNFHRILDRITQEFYIPPENPPEKAVVAVFLTTLAGSDSKCLVARNRGDLG